MSNPNGFPFDCCFFAEDKRAKDSGHVQRVPATLSSGEKIKPYLHSFFITVFLYFYAEI